MSSFFLTLHYTTLSNIFLYFTLIDYSIDCGAPYGSLVNVLYIGIKQGPATLHLKVAGHMDSGSNFTGGSKQLKDSYGKSQIGPR